MNELEILQAISLLSGKNDKRELLEKNKDNKRLGELLDASLNFFRKFYINKFDITDIALTEIDLHDEFMGLLSKLENREITGNTAKQTVEGFLNKCSSDQQLWYTRVLRKDIKIGVSVDTAAKYFNIPTFDVMLATDGKKCKQLDKIISQGVYVSPKFDGYRCLAVIDNGDVTLYSRNGSEFTNFPTIKDSLAKSFPNSSIVLDGEIMSDDFQAMQKSAFASKRGTTVGDVAYHVFNFIPLDEWKSGKFQTTTKGRLHLLRLNAEYFNSDLIKLVDQEYTKDLNRIKELEKEFLSKGYEGAMVLPDIPYYRGRSTNKLMKFKTMMSQDCVITDFYEGKVGTKHQGRMGGIVVKQENDEVCDCGSGFSDEDRDYMWNNKNEFLGRTVEIKFQELTADGIMRFPIFMRFRDDKTIH